jgi:hypothetical protein
MIEVNKLTAVLKLNVDPSDVMRLCHRMKNCANSYVEKLAIDLYLGNMLFAAGINGTCYKLLHRRAAANCRNSLFLDDLDNLSACFTNIELYIFHYTNHLSNL